MKRPHTLESSESMDSLETNQREPTRVERTLVHARRSCATKSDFSARELRLLAAKLAPSEEPPLLPQPLLKRARRVQVESGLSDLASSLQTSLRIQQDEPAPVVCPLTQVKLRPGRPVRPYQAEIVFWSERLRGGIICADMGLGKTAIALLALARELDPDIFTRPDAVPSRPCLVVASSEETIVEWTNELKNFPTLAHACYELDKPCPEHGLVLTTYDALATRWERVKLEHTNPDDPDELQSLLASTIFGVQFGSAFIDECQKIANEKTRWHKALRKIKAERKFGLSGTPLSNGVDDVRAQLKFCLGAPAVAQLRDSQLKDYIFVLDYQQAGVAMPDKTVTLRSLEMDAETRSLYARVEASGLRKIVRMTILRQVCIAASVARDVLEKYELVGSARAWLDDPNSSAGLASPKFLVLAEILQSVCVEKQRQLLVFSTSAKALSLALQLVPRGVSSELICDLVPAKERKQIVKQFKQGRVRVLFLTYKLGSEGLNFQNCSDELTLDDWWTDSSRSQAHARTFRSGQEHDVHITRLHLRDSIDEHVAEVATRKGREQANLLGKR